MVESRGSDKKRKYGGNRMAHGSHRGGRDRKNLSRNEQNRQGRDRRAENDEVNAKRRKIETENEDGTREGEAKGPYMPPVFSQAEIEGEERKPKAKVAVLFGYAGTGYKGLQIDAGKKTIEGSLFNSLVTTGLVSKANANDPRKSALSRCARTDKGVHAAGNVISMKLTTHEDYTEPIAKLNADLGSQAIRVWGIQRTINSFSAYQGCDSRWYEYLIPTHVFLPPHPSSHLAKKLEVGADDAGDREGYEARQAEVKGYWAETERKYIKPIVDDIPQHVRAKALDAVLSDGRQGPTSDSQSASDPTVTKEEKDDLAAAIKSIKKGYADAKRDWRITPARLARIQPTLNHFLGTSNYHAYTEKKPFKDPSAKRLIKSFTVSTDPILINRHGVRVTSEDDDTALPPDAASQDTPMLTADRTTEWLSLKVHGQSFMMHQIRKMVSMLVLCIRCGTDASKLIPTSFGPFDKGPILPRAPGLGLLLLNPVFAAYNEGRAYKHGRNPVDFAKPSVRKPMDEFTEKEIYRRIWGEEMGLFEPATNSSEVKEGSNIKNSGIEIDDAKNHDDIPAEIQTLEQDANENEVLKETQTINEDEFDDAKSQSDINAGMQTLEQGSHENKVLKETQTVNEDEDYSQDEDDDEGEDEHVHPHVKRTKKQSLAETGTRNKDAFVNFLANIDSAQDADLRYPGSETRDNGKPSAYAGYGYLSSAGLKALIESVESKGWKIGEKGGFKRAIEEEEEEEGMGEEEKEEKESGAGDGERS
ncbi:MAG: tRNA pseudouridine synthase 1 [Chrysothrix sp. TS-e1954]|nr:MAG: tRNA pseudouridine synthase 1 [Chrysothrix sp. TS-e1954]